MKPRVWSVMVAMGFVAALTSVVNADDKTRTGGTSKTGMSQTNLNYEGAFNGCRGSKLVGADVKNSAGKDLGKIKDVVVDPESGRVAYAVLQFGGFMGVGDKLFAIPWRSMQLRDDDLVTLDIEKSQLENAQGFEDKDWPNMADQQWATTTHKHFGQEPYWNVDVDIDVKDNQGRTPTALQVLRLSTVIGKTIENNADKNIGDVNDVVLDASRGQIAYAVLGVGGFIGIGEDLVAVPWEKLDVMVKDRDDATIRLAMTEEELKNGPHFSKDQWPNADDKNYLIRVYTFYDTDPYWQKSHTGRVSDATNP